MDFKDFKNKPRNFAFQLVEEGHTTEKDLLIACLGFLSHDDVREMLDNNELSPRFFDEEEDEEEDYDEEDEEDEEDYEEGEESDLYNKLLYNELFALCYPAD